MGTGKTTIAKRLAGKTGMKYISTDDLIEQKEGMPINDIFSKKGEPHFREIEKKVISEISDSDNIVVDAGGGAVLNIENIRNFRKKGVLVCLWSEPEDIYERTNKFKHRPLLNVDSPLKKIKDLLDKRRPFYERADYFVNTSSVNINEAVDSILKFVKK